MPPSLEPTPELLREYVQEMREIFGHVSDGLLRLETAPDDCAALEAVLRGFHSVKGTSGYLDLQAMVDLAHAAEDLLTGLRDAGRRITPDHVDPLLVALDFMRTIVDEVDRGTPAPGVDAGSILQILRARATGEAPAPLAPPAPDPEALRDYVQETRDILATLDARLLRLENAPADPETIPEVFRGFHRVREAADSLGLQPIAELAHAAEETLGRVRDTAGSLTTDHVDTLLVVLDYLRSMLQEIESGTVPPSVDITGALHLLSALDAPTTPPPDGALPPPAPVPPRPETPVIVAPEPAAGPRHAPPGAPPPDPTQPATVQTPPAEADTTVRLDVERLDALLTLVGELHLRRNQLHRTGSQAARLVSNQALADRLLEEMNALRFVSDELHAAVLRTRMLPVSRAFGKLPRIVRDAARNAGKDVVLDITGEDTRLDRALIEEIGSPLIHLVRNAVDHGIEAPAEREASGKPRAGRLSLTAYHEGNRVVIRVSDDGAGIDPARVRARAVARGLLASEQEAGLTEGETLDLLFRPGFSTRDTATSLSGRGVGLDVVRANVQRLHGVIEVDTAPGAGTHFRLKIPLTLAVVPVLLVATGADVYAVPATAIIEALRISPKDVRNDAGRRVYEYQGRPLPVAWLGDLFLVPDRVREAAPGRHVYLVVLAAVDRRAGLIVDRLTGQQEVIVKPLGPHLEDTAGMTGAAVLEDGRVSLVLDVAAVVNRLASVPPAAALAQAGER